MAVYHLQLHLLDTFASLNVVQDGKCEICVFSRHMMIHSRLVWQLKREQRDYRWENEIRRDYTRFATFAAAACTQWQSDAACDLFCYVTMLHAAALAISFISSITWCIVIQAERVGGSRSTVLGCRSTSPTILYLGHDPYHNSPTLSSL